MRRDTKTGKFLRIKKGHKSPRMIEAEKLISKLVGRKITLEKDYKNQYLEGNLGQKKLANRWQVGRGLIFGYPRGGRRNWVKILNLPKKDSDKETLAQPRRSRLCEICSDDAPLHNAHWIPSSEGGPAKVWNLIKLCGSCHNKFDLRGAKELGLKILKTILKREVFKIYLNEKNEKYQKDKIYELYEKLIVNGKKYRKF